MVSGVKLTSSGLLLLMRAQQLYHQQFEKYILAASLWITGGLLLSKTAKTPFGAYKTQWNHLIYREKYVGCG